MPKVELLLKDRKVKQVQLVLVVALVIKVRKVHQVTRVQHRLFKDQQVIKDKKVRWVLQELEDQQVLLEQKVRKVK